jgi:hypothetical protein
VPASPPAAASFCLAGASPYTHITTPTHFGPEAQGEAQGAGRGHPHRQADAGRVGLVRPHQRAARQGASGSRSPVSGQDAVSSRVAATPSPCLRWTSDPCRDLWATRGFSRTTSCTRPASAFLRRPRLAPVCPLPFRGRSIHQSALSGAQPRQSWGRAGWARRAQSRPGRRPEAAARGRRCMSLLI